MQYELQGREGMRALEMNRTSNLRAGMAPIATSARVAAAIAGLPPAPPDAAAVMTAAAVAKAKATAPLAVPVQELVAEEVPVAKAKAKLKAVLKPPPHQNNRHRSRPPIRCILFSVARARESG